MKQSWCLAVVLLPIHILAQDTCSCSSNLDRFITKVEHNYAGFKDKVTDTTRPAYQSLVDSLRQQTSVIADKSICFHALEAYRLFFRDKHLQLGGPFSPRADGTTSALPRMTSWTPERLKDYFTIHREPLRTLEGAWSMDPYEVGIVYNDSTALYDAVIIKSGDANWKEGMVKFTITEPVEGRSQVSYWRGDLNMEETWATYAPGHLAMKGIGTWHMLDPPPGSMNARSFELEHGEEVRWKLLDDSTLYIKLGSCDLANKAVLDSLVSANEQLLDRVPNWIVDFRANGGGSTDVFQSLLPYMYTKPFKEYGVNHWMSPDNTTALRDWLAQNKDMVDKGSARSIQRCVDQGTKHPDTWAKEGESTSRFGNGKLMPQRIAILADKGTASSGQAFLELARGTSDKAVIFGENTGGFMDYGDVMPQPLGCDGLVVGMPTSRMNRIDHGFSYDLNGIAPDVRIPQEEKDQLRFVQAYWATHAR